MENKKGLPGGEIERSEMMSAFNSALAWAKKNPGQMDPERVKRAMGLLQKTEINEYRTTWKSCDCPDYSRKNDRTRTIKINGEKVQYSGGCKHMAFEMILVKIKNNRKAHDVTELVTVPVKRAEETILADLGY